MAGVQVEAKLVDSALADPSTGGNPVDIISENTRALITSLM